MTPTAPANSYLTELRSQALPLAGAVLGIAVSYLPGYAIGVFLKPLSQEFDWSLTQVAGWSLGYSLGCIVSAPFCGWIADASGPRRVIAVSQLGLIAVLLASGRTIHDLWQLYGCAFAAGICITGAGSVTFARILTRLFDKGLGTALGIMSAGIGVSAGFGPRLVQAIVDSGGWRWGFESMALFVSVSAPLVWFAIRPRSAGLVAHMKSDSGNGMSVSAAFRTNLFWLFALGALLYLLLAGSVCFAVIRQSRRSRHVMTSA